jgi:PAS domain S-box-containing protein
MKDKKKTKHKPYVSSPDESMFRIMAEKSPNMIFVNKGGRVIYANEKCEEIMGYSKEEFYSPDFYFLSIIAPESQEMVKDNFLKHMKGDEVPPSTYSLITKDGRKIDVINSTSLISLDNEKAILGILTDITEQKKSRR